MSPSVNLRLHERQAQALNSVANEILYGGAAGGGKSHLLRVAAIYWCSLIPGLQAYLFRRVFDDLVANHIDGPKGFRSMLAPWVECGFVEIVADEIRFWNGSKIHLCHCQHDEHRYKYQGAEIHLLLIDELTHFSEVVYRFLRSRVRAVGLNIPSELQRLIPRIIAASNPGNIGHAWVKATFVAPKPEMEIWQTPDDEGGMLRQYIPARLEDNPSMDEDDPQYRVRLRGLGSPELVRAMELGDWDVIAGAFFDEFRRSVHVCSPFEVPPWWLRFRSMDWGSAKPFSIGWWTVSDQTVVRVRGQDCTFPKGALIRYREWYGASGINIGLKMTPGEVAEGIRDRSGREDYVYSVADPACFAKPFGIRGPSVVEEMKLKGVIWRPGDNDRIQGWNQFRQRLRVVDGQPMLYVFDTCVDFVRTIPALQHDENKPEDVDSDGEDHIGDESRYACMSRPFVVTEKKKEPMKGMKELTLDQLIAKEESFRSHRAY